MQHCDARGRPFRARDARRRPAAKVAGEPGADRHVARAPLESRFDHGRTRAPRPGENTTNAQVGPERDAYAAAAWTGLFTLPARVTSTSPHPGGGPSGYRTAAVLVPVFRDAEHRLRLVLVVRADHGIHGGQLGLPGGAAEPEDANLVETALREAEEEVGLLRDEVEVLASLDPIDSRVSGFRVHPFLARVPANARWQLRADEIVGILTPLVEELADPGVRRELPFTSAALPDGLLVEGISIEGHVLWGLTLRLLDPLLPSLLAGEWPL